MADLLTVVAFESRTGRTLSGSETVQAEAHITDASALVVDIVGDTTITGTWTAANVPGSIVPVLVNMVRRALDNPHGYTSEQNSGYLYQGGKSEGIFATRDERRTIRKAAGKSPAGAMNLDSYLPRSRLDGGTDWTLTSESS